MNRTLCFFMIIYLLTCFGNSLSGELQRQVGTNQACSIRQKDDVPVIVIVSPKGIGREFLERAEFLKGKKIIIRLYLKGLELFRLSTGLFRLKVSCPSSSPGMCLKSFQAISSTKELPLDNMKNITLSVVKKSEGYFEITVPATVTQYFSEKTQIEWIDFYR